MKIPEIIKIAANSLRKNSTKAEIILWEHIKSEKLGIKFLRQKPIYAYTENNGLNRFIIADFYSAEKKLILEIDGSIHNIPEIEELDQVKENLLKNLEYKVLRIKNEEIFGDIKGVLEKIKAF